jgi:hypothetical protein
MPPRKSARRAPVETVPEPEPESEQNGDATADVSEGGAESAGVGENGSGMTMEERMAKMQALRKKKVRIASLFFPSICAQ